VRFATDKRKIMPDRSIKNKKHSIIRIKESDGVLFDFFSRNARYNSGQYLIERNGVVLVGKSPAELFEKLKNQEKLK